MTNSSSRKIWWWPFPPQSRRMRGCSTGRRFSFLRRYHGDEATHQKAHGEEAPFEGSLQDVVTSARACHPTGRRKAYLDHRRRAPRRAPIALGHENANGRHAADRPKTRRRRLLVVGSVGRRHVRYLFAISERRSVGTPACASRRHAAYEVADAASGPKPRGLPALCG